jgi:hypothetical protein
LSDRIDLSINDRLSDDTNTWWTRVAGTKTESGNNNIIHHRAVNNGSNSSAATSPIVISAATQANPVVITATGHGLSAGAFFRIRKILGMTELNNQIFKAGTVATNTIELQDPNTSVDVDGTDFTAYSSAGYLLTGVPMNSIEDLGSGSHLYDYFHQTDGSTAYLWRSLRDSDGLVRSSMTTNGSFFTDRQIHINQSAFNFEPFKIGNHYFWMNGNDYRGSIGVPSSATAGALIATLT